MINWWRLIGIVAVFVTMVLMAYGMFIFPFWFYGDHGPFVKPGVTEQYHGTYCHNHDCIVYCGNGSCTLVPSGRSMRNCALRQEARFCQ